MKDNIMVFGGGELQISMIETIKRMGFNAVVIDPLEDAPANKIADIFEVVAANDYDTTLALAKKHDIKGIITTSLDNPMIMMARLAEELNLSFPSLESVSTILDKGRFKQFMLTNDIPCAKGKVYCLNEKISYSEIFYPVIIKPVNRSGSRGVLLCKNERELRDSIAETAQSCSNDEFIIEEQLIGDEISVEALIYKGRVEIIQITDYILYNFPPYNVPFGQIQPSKYSHLSETFYNILQKITDLSGLDNCAVHAEMMVKDNQPKIIEMGPRLGGGYITSMLVPLSTGIDMEAQLVRIASNNELANINTDRTSFAFIKYIVLPEGFLMNKEITEEHVLKQFSFVHKFKMKLSKGQRVPSTRSVLDRPGYWIVTGFTYEDVIEKAEIVNKYILQLLNY